MKELKEAIETLKDRISKSTNEDIKGNVISDLLFLVEKQHEYIKQLEGLLESTFEITKTL